jgi:beta-phosphoglucomutase-like phosphatase (HAD superfamily)
MRFDAIIFDFDGVLIESELELNRLTAELLAELGHQVTLEEALRSFSGRSHRDAIEAIEARIGTGLPPTFHDRMREGSARALEAGIDAVAGAIEFVRSLPLDLPKAVASSSRTWWISTHLEKLGLAENFGPHLYSGAEHVTRGKPAPDLYLYAAAQLGVPIARCVIIEDSEVGATGAVASGAKVIGLAAGLHCLDDHCDRLQALGVEHVARSFDDVARLVGLDQISR